MVVVGRFREVGGSARILLDKIGEHPWELEKAVTMCSWSSVRLEGSK